MTKHTQLEVLSNLKLNGALYTETGNGEFPAICFQDNLSSWVYKNSNSAEWIKFSDSNFNLISSNLTNDMTVTELDIANINVMTSYI
jgi:hypothetical protein